MTLSAPPLCCLPPFNEEGAVHVVIETPKGSPNKYALMSAVNDMAEHDQPL